MTRALISFAPRLLQAPETARYLGVSQSKLHGLPVQRRVSAGNRLFDRYDLDSYANSLPYEDQDSDELEACDRAFGIVD